MNKRYCFLLIICLLCGMFPLTAMAEETTMGDRPPLPTNARELSIHYGDFQAAFEQGLSLREALTGGYLQEIKANPYALEIPNGYLDDAYDLSEFVRYAYETEAVFGSALESVGLQEVYVFLQKQYTTPNKIWMIYYVTEQGDFVLVKEVDSCYAINQMYLFPFEDYYEVICTRKNAYVEHYKQQQGMKEDWESHVPIAGAGPWIGFYGLMTKPEMMYYHWETMRYILEQGWADSTPASLFSVPNGEETIFVPSPGVESNDEGETTEPPLGTSAKNPVSPWIWGISWTVLFAAAVAVSFFLGTKRGKQSVKQT